MDGVPQIGTKSVAELREDGSFSIDTFAATIDAMALQSENDALKARIAELEAAASNKGKGAGK